MADNEKLDTDKSEARPFIKKASETIEPIRASTTRTEESVFEKQGSLDPFLPQPDDSVRKSTMLEGIMGIQNKTGPANLNSVGSPITALRGVQAKPELGVGQTGAMAASQATKSASLMKAKQLAEDIQRSYADMMGLIGELQKETGMIVKTQDLDKEFAKVFARVKVIGKL